MRQKSRIWAAFTWVIVASGMWAGERFQTYTIENGLPSDAVLAIRQTRDGYIWFTTYKGIVRFDGSQFQIFDPSNTPAIIGTNFAAFCLLEDSLGRLWAGGWNNGAIYYQNGKFTGLTTADGLPSNLVYRIDEDVRGVIWIFTDKGLARFKDGKLQVVRVIDGEPVDRYLEAPPNLGIDPYLLGLWRVRATGIDRFAYGEWIPLPLPQGINPLTVKLDWLIEDSKRQIWFNILSMPGRSFGVTNGELSVFKGLPKGSFINYRDRWGRLWITEASGQTSVWANGIATRIPEVPAVSNYRVLEDAAGGFWLGTPANGLAHGTRQAITTLRLPGGANINQIGPITQDPAGDIWIGSYGVTRLHAGKFTRYPFPGTMARETQRIRALWWDDGNGTLLAGYARGIKLLRNGRYIDTTDALAQIHSGVNVIMRDRSRTLWIGTADGLFRYSANVLTTYNASNSPLKGDIRALFEDHLHNVWIGTESGLAKYTSGTFSYYGPRDDLSHWRVRSITEDSNGVIWARTGEKGLLRIAGNRLVWIQRKNGLYTNDGAGIVEDANGYFWNTSILGLVRVKRADLDAFAEGRTPNVNSEYFGKGDGLDALNTNGDNSPHALAAKDGTLWFPTSSGIARIDPRDIHFDNSPPPVRIDGCSVQQQPVPCKGELFLPPGAGGVEIKYGALSLFHSGQVKFKYLLDGVDQEYTSPGSRTVAYYPHLPPGTYRFFVTAANSQGIWNPKPSMLTIKVAPHYYQAVWFRWLMFGLGVAAVLAAWMRRTKAFERKQAAQRLFTQQIIASQEEERKRIAGELHDSLGQRLALINSMIQMVHRQADEATESRIREIGTEAKMAAAEVRQISHNLRPYQLDLLGLGKAMELLTKRSCEGAGLEFHFNADDLAGAFAAEFEIHFYRVLQECLNNIVKHAQARAVWVEIKREAGTVSLVVADDGVGFYTGAERADGRLGGFGMKGIAERSQILGGSASIQSSPGHGTEIRITVKETSQAWIQEPVS